MLDYKEVLKASVRSVLWQVPVVDGYSNVKYEPLKDVATDILMAMGFEWDAHRVLSLLDCVVDYGVRRWRRWKDVNRYVKWVDEFVDMIFETIAFHEFTHWAIMDERRLWCPSLAKYWRLYKELKKEGNI